MRDPDRIDPMLQEIERIWKENPDWRLGQVIGNAIRETNAVLNTDFFFIEDDVVMKGLKKL